MLTTLETEKIHAPEIKNPSKTVAREIPEALEKHAIWLNSAGQEGIKAELSRKNLAGADLVDCKLRDAILHKTILKGADLTLADFRRASLLQANLAEANLLGTQFQLADLQAADLRGAKNLLSVQLAGTNLFGAILPEEASPSDGLKHVRHQAAKAGWLLALTLFLEALVWLRIFTTTDNQLVKNSSAFPVAALQTTLPFVPFYLFGPVLILVMYVCFHLYMQRLWEGAAQLPAVFPDGQRLDALIPWHTRWPARKGFHWLSNSQSAVSFLEAVIAKILFYWATPATVLLFWGRYLTLEDLRGTMLHIFLATGAIIAAMYFPMMAVQAFELDAPLPTGEKESPPRIGAIHFKAVTPAAGFVLILLSVGTFLGVPHRDPSATHPSDWGIRSWAADAFWAVGYNPFAQLTETDVSSKPLGWTGRDEDVPLVKGANLNQLNLRHVQAYRSFLVKGRFWRSNLQSAYLSEADLREANLRQANLQAAVLDHARLNRATLREADLRLANLDRADLRDADLSFAALSEAMLLDATLDGANVYKSDLHAAQLQRASLKNADLREANLEGTNLVMANLERSYLDSTNLRSAELKNADLTQAILTEAKLQKSDLSGAILQGAVLSDAALNGANLEGADLRGAAGLTPAQLCSASSLRGAQMDDTLVQSVTMVCGNIR